MLQTHRNSSPLLLDYLVEETVMAADVNKVHFCDFYGQKWGVIL